jgi:ferric-dicitrate binding protein FerR (iron transport regulator)
MSQDDDAGRNGVNRNGPPPFDAVQDEALRWFLKLQATEGDAAVRRAFDTWLARDQRHAAAYARVVELWKSEELGQALTGRGPVRNGSDRCRADFGRDSRALFGAASLSPSGLRHGDRAAATRFASRRLDRRAQQRIGDCA